MLNYAAATSPARFAAPPSVLFNIDEPRGPAGTVMRFARNSEIYGEDEAAEYFYQVISGAVRAYKILDDGRRQISAFYLPGDIFGLEAGDEYTSSADAIADSDIADYLGLTIETVSRTLTQFEYAGLIALPASRRVELRDCAALNRMNS